ncbi:MAG: hypothetical protein RL380_358 [Verrucomicrobiota bacterium]|jgi:hypothetical protein
MQTIDFNAASEPNPQKFEALAKLKSRGYQVVDARQSGTVLCVDLDAPESRSLDFGSSPVGRPLRILCVHGVNHLEPAAGAPPTPNEQAWRDAIAAAATQWGLPPQLEFIAYNELFDTAKLTPFVLAKSVTKLAASGLWHGLGDLFGARAFGPQGGFGDTLEWTAGMVCEWAGNDPLRKKLRARMLQTIADFRPDLILAHSLGTLVTYDTLARPENQAAPGVTGLTLATFGSQIGHPTVREVFGGRIMPLPVLRHWFHLYNKHDHVFTAPLDVRFPNGVPPNFSQHPTTFDVPGDVLNHDCARYLQHREAIASVWRDAATLAGSVPRKLAGFPQLLSLMTSAEKKKLFPPAKKSRAVATPAIHRGKPQKRALLIGLAEYPDPANNLAGCANDVFLMSRLLQERGFDAANIRVALNHRATASGILNRLHWLLDGAQDGHDRVFYYAGHGAQIPGYGVGETVDRLDECLVPYDFDWTREHAVVDDQFYELYSQLPEQTRFLTILDCCHSGGMTREGSVRARGLALPDDIRHRILEWSGDTFRERTLSDGVNTYLQAKPTAVKKQDKKYRFGPLRRLGCAAGLRGADAKQFDAARTDFGHHGPFMPFILQACAEGELAYEYRHGSQSNGAFTWFLGEVLQANKNLAWEKLVEKIGDRITAQGYQQHPQLVCPTALRPGKIPWTAKR